MKLREVTSLKALEFIKDRENGWFWRAKSEILPIIE
jgi:hypothetical protein